MMNTLYYAPGACSLSVHIMLEWLGEPYRAVRVNYTDPEYHKFNPAGQVPALDIGDGTLLTQCSAILAYLAHTQPGAALAGDEISRKGYARAWANESFVVAGDVAQGLPSHPELAERGHPAYKLDTALCRARRGNPSTQGGSQVGRRSPAPRQTRCSS